MSGSVENPLENCRRLHLQPCATRRDVMFEFKCSCSCSSIWKLSCCLMIVEM